MMLRAWAKFNELDLVCMCAENKCKDCSCGYGCTDYIVRFTPIETGLEYASDRVTSDLKKLGSELDKISNLSKNFLK